MSDHDDRWARLARELLSTLDRERELTVRAIHNRSIQHVIAARLVFETVLGDRRDELLVTRGLDALERAATSARDLMWALTDPLPRREQLAADLAQHLARCGTDLAVTAAVEEASPAALQLAAVAVHDLVATAPDELGPLASLDLREDAESLEAVVRWDRPVTVGQRWHGQTVAGLRLALHGGALEAVDGALLADVPLDLPAT